MIDSALRLFDATNSETRVQSLREFVAVVRREVGAVAIDKDALKRLWRFIVNLPDPALGSKRLQCGRVTELLGLSDHRQTNYDIARAQSQTTVTALAAFRHFQPYRIVLAEFLLEPVSGVGSYPSCRTYPARWRVPEGSLRESNIAIWTFHCPPVWESVEPKSVQYPRFPDDP